MGLRTIVRRPRASGTDESRRRRRHPVAALAGVVLLLVAFAGTQPAAAQEEPPPGILPPGEWTEAQANWLVDKVAEAEEKLPQFDDPSTLPEGFVNIGPVVAGYSHYVNVDWMVDDHSLNPEYPESIIYDPSGRAVAVMFFMNPEMTLETLPSLISWMPGWHDHPELCSDDQGRVVGTPINGQCIAGHVVTNPMLHVWITDPGCGHRFGGLGVGGLHCEYEHEDH
jgi:hypothetical protein